MASKDNSSKGNGAATRMSNPKHAALRARSWRNGEARKAARVRQNELLHDLKVQNHGLGQREMRRVKAGIRPRPLVAA